MKQFKIFIFIILFCACSNIRKDRKLVEVSKPAFEVSFTSEGQFNSISNVNFSQEGARFKINTKASYLKLDTIPQLSENFNISFWFQVSGEDGRIPQVLFRAFNKENTKEQLAIWVAGFRVTGSLNNNVFSSKDYSKDLPSSRKYYDLPRLEVGKYYFFSLNKIENKIQIFINAELYDEFNLLKDSHILINSFIFGVLNTEGPYKNQFSGTLRNLEIYEQPLNKDEIYSVSVKHFKEIQPFNDAFELSKFKIEE